MAITKTMVHDIDTARWLLDDEIESFRVLAGNPNSAGRSHLAVAQTAGRELEASRETCAVAFAESKRVAVRSPCTIAGRVPADWRERFIEAYDLEIAAWISAASAGGATGPSAWDGYAITAVSDAGLQAAETGEAVEVSLVDRPGLYG